MLDEFAKWDETATDAWISVADATRSRLPVSTPYGMAVKFAQLRFSGAIEVETLHWSKHPLKAVGLYHETGKDGQRHKPRSIWYDAECERRADDPAAVAQELDIDYLKSGSPYFDNSVIQSRYIAAPSEIGDKYAFEVYEDPAGKKEIITIESEKGGVSVLSDPEDTHENRYCVGCDVAEGLEKGDNSAFYVYDRMAKQDVDAGRSEGVAKAEGITGFAWILASAVTGVILGEIGYMALRGIGRAKDAYGIDDEIFSSIEEDLV
jgi:hypothetical protein